MKVKEESTEAGLKLNIQKTKIMASGPTTSWQKDGEKMETVTDFIFLCSKITADGDCSHETQKCLLLGRKAMTNLAAAAAKSHRRVRLCATPQMAAHQAPLSLGFSKQEYWSGCCHFLLPSRSKCLLISGLQSPSTVILEPKKIKSVTVSIVSQ